MPIVPPPRKPSPATPLSEAQALIETIVFEIDDHGFLQDEELNDLVAACVEYDRIRQRLLSEAMAETGVARLTEKQERLNGME